MRNYAKRLFFSALTVYFTVAALIKLFGFEAAGWASFIPDYLEPYELVVATPFENVREAFASAFGFSIPQVLRDVAVLWVAIGRIVRRVIGDIADGLAADSDKYNPQPKRPFGERVQRIIRHPIAELKAWAAKPDVREGFVATFWWPKRLWADLKGDTVTYRKHDPETGETRKVCERQLTIYWSLSPLRLLIYTLVSFAVMGLLLAIDYRLLNAGSS